jgi:N-acetylglucosamine-6-sulfatase
MGMGRAVRLLTSVATAVLVASVVVLVVVLGSARSGAAAPKPNIVFVLTDDQFPGTQNAMPALKSNITSEGLTFTKMTSTFPLCCPGRATILRGQYAHNTHIYGNSLPLGGWAKFRNLGEQKSTIATWLNSAGYQTGLFGKYLNNYGGLTKPPGWDRWYAWNSGPEGWNALNDQGTQKPLTPQKADSGVSQAALEFLDNRLNKAAPVFAYVNFGAEHSPYHHAKIDDDKFKGVGVPRNASFNEDNVSDKPSKIRSLPKLSGSQISDLDRDYRNGLRSLMRVDRFIGDASDLLRRKGEMGNTYFVFYTDNGTHFGQHRLPHGKLKPYKEDTGFPLIVRGPGIPRGATNGDLLGNHDIAPTLASMGGANIPAFVDGRSFLGLTKNPSGTWPRTAVLSEMENNDSPPHSWDMLRMPQEVYTRYEGPDREYYDLAKDPLQLHNALGAGDTTYLPPDTAIREYYEQRLHALTTCSGHAGAGSCVEAEDAPLLPVGTTP